MKNNHKLALSHPDWPFIRKNLHTSLMALNLLITPALLRRAAKGMGTFSKKRHETN
jgi:hypothetical protein